MKLLGDCNLQIRLNDGKYVLAISQENGDVVYQINEHTIIPVITKALQELIVKVQAIEKIIEKKEG